MYFDTHWMHVYCNLYWNENIVYVVTPLLNFQLIMLDWGSTGSSKDFLKDFPSSSLWEQRKHPMTNWCRLEANLMTGKIKYCHGSFLGGFGSWHPRAESAKQAIKSHKLPSRNIDKPHRYLIACHQTDLSSSLRLHSAAFWSWHSYCQLTVTSATSQPCDDVKY